MIEKIGGWYDLGKIRQCLPDRWVVVEAINAFTENGKRIVCELHIIDVFDGDDTNGVWECYKRVHAADKYREYYFLHTDREVLDIGVTDEFRRKLS